MSSRSRCAAAILVVLGAGAVAPGAGAARTKTVVLEDIAFTPEVARITRGDRVRWVWRDESTPHNVRARGTTRFTGSSTKTEGTHTVRFAKAGTYRYLCTIHLGMDARVVVR